MSQPELLYVEQPALINSRIGWSYKMERTAPDTSIFVIFKEVVLTPNLEQAIKRINPWISEKILGRLFVILRDSNLT